jgi:hypothetical protein
MVARRSNSQAQNLESVWNSRSQAIDLAPPPPAAHRRLRERLESRHGRPVPPMQNWTMSQRHRVAFCKSYRRPLPKALPVR